MIRIECGTANYTYEGGILNIKDNDWYLKGKYYVTLEDTNMLILKQEFHIVLLFLYYFYL